MKFDFKRMLPLTMRDSHVSVARLRVELKNETDSNVFCEIDLNVYIYIYSVFFISSGIDFLGPHALDEPRPLE